MDAAVSQNYVNWYSHFVTTSGVTRSGRSTCTGCVRVQRPDVGNDTVSEGIGYGMLIAVMMDDKTLFDGIWNYAVQWIPDSSNHWVMDWNLDSSGNIKGANGATDADEDMAMALLMADKIWGSTGAINYKMQYQNMINAIWNYEIGGGGQVYSGDAYQFPYYSSYMTPAWYKCWNSNDSANHAWTSPANWVYGTYLPTIFNNNGKLGFMPNQADSSLNPTGSSPTQMGYDASRYPLRIGIDWLWNKSAGASIVTTFASTVESGVNANGANSEILEYWTINSAPYGGPTGSNCNDLQIGPALVASLSLPNNAANQSYITGLYTNMMSRYPSCGTWTYFQDSVCLLSQLVATGNFPNIVCGTPPCGSQTCTPTPSPTPLSCYMLDDLEDGNGQNNVNGYWFTFGYASVNNTPVATPQLYTVSGPTSVVYVGGAPTGPSYSAFVTGSCAINGGTTTVYYGGSNQLETVYAGYALATELTAGYRNLSSAPTSMTNISFYIKSTSAPQTVRLNFYNPAVDPSNGGNANQYGFMIPVTLANNWQYVSVPSGIANILPESWGPASAMGATLGYAQAMTNVTSLQWVAQAPATGTNFAFWIDQVCLAGMGWMTPTPLPTATPVTTVLPTFTFTSSPTITPTPTKTMTNTATNSPTFTLTNTPTPTATLTVTNTATNTQVNTFTPTSTLTNSPTYTATLSPTNSPTYTPTSLPTNTATLTPTNTLANTATNTVTKTATATLTSTATPTATLTATFTRTFTATSTATSTATQTATPTITNTPTDSPTGTLTPPNTSTPTSTATNTGTSTPTFTPTLTATLTPTSTATLTATSSATATATNTAVNTATNTFTSTATNTLVNTATATSTPTNTATLTPTNTLMNTATPTSTATKTATLTPTSTATLTPTSTATLTATRTATSTATLTATNTPVNTFTATSTATNTATFTPTFTPTASPTTQPTVVFTQIPSSLTVAPGQTLTYTLAVTVSGSQAQNVVVTDNLPSNVTYNSATGGSVVVNGSQVTWNAGTVPAGSAVTLAINVTVSPSATDGSNLSNQALLTYLGGSAQSTTSSVTVVVPTATATATSTVSSTPTSSPTPQAATSAVVYPNPSSGGPVNVMPPSYVGTADVKVQVFTIAFRKVLEQSFPQIPLEPVTLTLTDNGGSPLASGLYYVVVTVNPVSGTGQASLRSVAKLLLIR